MEDPQVAKGFDRGVDYNDMRKRLTDERKLQVGVLQSLKPQEGSKYDQRLYTRTINKVIYLTIAILQLVNGSRISEACNALTLFLQRGTKELVVVKIAKSKSIKTNKDGEQYETKTRYRKMKFPKWIKLENPELYLEYLLKLKNVKACVLGFLLTNFQCNTHSLRYAAINHFLYDLKQEMALVAKFVGHSNTAQICLYSQNKRVDELFNLDDGEC